MQNAGPLLFGEAQGRIVLSCEPEDTGAILELAGRHGVPARRIGFVTAPEEGLRIRTRDQEVHVEVTAAVDAWTGALPRRMDQTLTADAE